VSILIVSSKRSKKAGLPPGTVVHVGEERREKVRLSVISYNEVDFQEQEVDSVDKVLSFRKKAFVMWLNVDGVHMPEIIEQVGKSFGMHPLVLEDIADTGQRPKMEDFDDYIFVILKMFRFDDKEKQVKIEQISLILGSDFVLSFQEKEGDVFDPIRERLRNNKGRVRKAGADYLVYALMDAVIDNYFFIMEKLGETIEEIEDEVVISPTSETVQTIHDLKRQMIFLRKSVWPLREVISRLEQSDSTLIAKSTLIYLRDAYDHAIQVMDSVDTFRDTLSGMLDIYLSSVSNRMNEIMKVLTIIATIFIPLTFIAGVYGMNFRFMPELEQPWGYPLALIVMALIACVMLVYFRRKKWL
jgi:magnesium transporter